MTELVDPTVEKLLAEAGWSRPDRADYPTGRDWADGYLKPLADVLGDAVRYGTTVTGVAKRGRDLLGDADRDFIAIIWTI